jgi:hypothetical protein
MYKSFLRIVVYNLIALAVVLALSPEPPQRRQESQRADRAPQAQDASAHSTVAVDHAKAAMAERTRTPLPDLDTPQPHSR